MLEELSGSDAEALALRLRAHLAAILRMLNQPAPTSRAARRAQRRNKRNEVSP